MLFVIHNLLSDAGIQRVQSLLKQSKFIDGIATAKVAKSRKNNLEMELSESYTSLVELLDSALDASIKIKHRLLPRFRTYPIINRYEKGMFYGRHVDAPIQGNVTQAGRAPGRFGQNFIRTDYSMTLFLADPSTYQGGELELTISDEKRLIKLAAGSAVCYSTGIPHSVLPVTDGSRVAAIYWFQSMVRDSNVRRVLWDIYELEAKLKQDQNTGSGEQLADIRNNLVRYLADI